MIRVIITVYILSFCAVSASAQKLDYHWVFGDSVGINFNTNPPSVDTTRIIMTQEVSASISGDTGNLLFYVGCPNVNYITFPGSEKYTVRSFNDSIMFGGDSLAGHSSVTQGLIILPIPFDSVKYYIFHIGVAGTYVLNYSVVDMLLNGGLGEVTVSNVLLEDSVVEKMHAVKAANGKDWWLVCMSWKTPTSFIKYKLDSTGIHFKGKYICGQTDDSSTGQLIFSKDGSKVVSTGGIGTTYLYDFDRCSGEFSNPVFLDQYVSGPGTSVRYGCSFSPSGQFVYLSSEDSLWQFDTYASNIASSRQFIFTIPNNNYLLGQQMLGTDGRIYIASGYIDAVAAPFDSLNTHLHVINNPDNLGVSCNFMPYSFSLQGRRMYSGLPNMPNYNLGKLEGVNCDSILAAGVDDQNLQNKFSVYPNPARDKVHIKWKDVDAKGITIELLSMEGKGIINILTDDKDSETTINVSTATPGIYILKFVKDNQLIGLHKLVIVP